MPLTMATILYSKGLMKYLIPHTLPPWVALAGMAIDGDTEVGRML